MSKLFSLIFLLTSGLSSFGMEDMRIEYSIKSDTIDLRIAEGSCKIKGQVFGPDGSPLSNAMVSTADFVSQTITDSLGNYEFLVSDKDSSIFAYKLDFTEVIVYKYDFKSQHVVTIDFSLMPHIARVMNLKPVVYCYGDIKNASISYNFKTNLTYSYPEFQNEWNFSCDMEGNINVDGFEYPYLFWEGENSTADYSDCGEGSYLIKTDTVISHLESMLTSMNLNPREKTDFITFWGPKLVQKEYAIVKFLN